MDNQKWLDLKEWLSSHITEYQKTHKRVNIDRATVMLFKMFDYATVDKFGHICLYLDSFLIEELKLCFDCETTRINYYKEQLMNIGFLKHEDRATYLIENNFYPYLRLWANDNACFGRATLKMRDNFKEIFSYTFLKENYNKRKAVITLNLLDSMYKHMSSFKSNNFFSSNISNIRDFFFNSFREEDITINLKKSFSVFEHLSPSTSDISNDSNTETLKKDSFKHTKHLKYRDTFNDLYFIFITPQIRAFLSSSMSDRREFHRSSYYNIFSALTDKNNGILYPVSSYRYFFDPNGDLKNLGAYKDLP